MKPRHEKHKPHLVKWYEAQSIRMSDCAFDASEILYTIQTNCIGTFYSGRFKNKKYDII